MSITKCSVRNALKCVTGSDTKEGNEPLLWSPDTSSWNLHGCRCQVTCQRAKSRAPDSCEILERNKFMSGNSWWFSSLCLAQSHWSRKKWTTCVAELLPYFWKFCSIFDQKTLSILSLQLFSRKWAFLEHNYHPDKNATQSLHPSDLDTSPNRSNLLA